MNITIHEKMKIAKLVGIFAVFVESTIPTGKLISTWAQVDPNDIIWSETFLCDQVVDNLKPNNAWQLEV